VLYLNPQIYPHLKAIFVHVPKAAGTSIERHLRQSDKDVVGGHTTALAFRGKFPNEFKSFYKFTVVRNPVDRFVSAYAYLRQMPLHPALNNEVVHECASVDEFVDKVQTTPDILKKLVHLLPQHQFVCGREGEILVDSVFRFEALEDGWKEICERVRIPHRPLAKLNPSREEHKPAVPSKGAAAFVEREYARDFEIFGYSK